MRIKDLNNISVTEAVLSSLIPIDSNIGGTKGVLLDNLITTIRNIRSKDSTEYRSLETRFADYVNVKDFGVKGDGSTNDTENFQKAVDAAYGKTLFIPNGGYILDTINISAAINIEGDGPEITELIPTTVGQPVLSCFSDFINIRNLAINNKNEIEAAGGIIYDYPLPVSETDRKASYCHFLFNCAFGYMNTAIRFKNAIRSTVDMCRFHNCLFSISLEDERKYGNGYITITNSTFNCDFDFDSVQKISKLIVQYGYSYLKVSNCSFIYGTYSYFGQFRNCKTDDSSITYLFLNNSFVYPKYGSIAFQNLNTTEIKTYSIRGIFIEGNYFTLPGGNAAAINIGTDKTSESKIMFYDVFVTNNIFVDPPETTPNSSIGFESVYNAIVGSNVFGTTLTLVNLINLSNSRNIYISLQATSGADLGVSMDALPGWTCRDIFKELKYSTLVDSEGRIK